MKLGIIVYSKTGTTLEFGRRIAAKLKEGGHDVDIVELKTDVPVEMKSARAASSFNITNLPDCNMYDALLVGGPVWAFTAAPVTVSCLKQLQGISGKKLLPFVTMGFPFAFMGGSHAISVMSRMAAQSGADILPGKIAPKMLRDQDKLMENAASEIPEYFK